MVLSGRKSILLNQIEIFLAEKTMSRSKNRRRKVKKYRSRYCLRRLPENKLKKTKRQKDKKTKRQIDKKTNREFNIVMSGQFPTLVMFFVKFT